MNYLINSNFKVLRKGTHVSASAEAGEWIYNSDDDSPSMGQLSEIAKANKLKVIGKKKADYQQSLNEALEKMEQVAEQNGPTQTEQVDALVKAGYEAGTSDDDIIVEIIKSGISFRRAGKMFKDSVERLGFRTSLKDVKEQASKLLAELDFNPSTYDEVKDILSKIKKETECDDKQAMQAVRSYAKSEEITLPKPEKGQRGAIGFRGAVYDWIMANPAATEADLKAYAEKEGKDGDKIVKRFGPVMELCQNFLAKHGQAAETAAA